MQISITSKTRNEVIPDLLNSFGLTKGVEVGVLGGFYSRIILENWIGTLYMVDAWRPLGEEYNDGFNHQNYPDVYRAAMHNVEGLERRGIMIRALSEDAVNIFPDESLDFVYIDANHAYEYVIEDMRLWWPKLRRGGIFSGHDFLLQDWYSTLPFQPNGKDKYVQTELCTGMFGVNAAVAEFCKQYNYNVTVTDEELGTWFFIK